MKEISSLRGKTPGIYRLKKDVPAWKKAGLQWEKVVLPKGQKVVRSTHRFLIGGGGSYYNIVGAQSYDTIEVKRRG